MRNEFTFGPNTDIFCDILDFHPWKNCLFIKFIRAAVFPLQYFVNNTQIYLNLLGRKRWIFEDLYQNYLAFWPLISKSDDIEYVWTTKNHFFYRYSTSPRKRFQNYMSSIWLIFHTTTSLKLIEAFSFNYSPYDT